MLVCDVIIVSTIGQMFALSCGRCYHHPVPGVAKQSDQGPHFSLCCRKSHIYGAHTNITPYLPHSNTYLCSARFILNVTHKHDNNINVQVIYCCACYLVGLLAPLNESRTRAAGWPPLFYTLVGDREHACVASESCRIFPRKQPVHLRPQQHGGSAIYGLRDVKRADFILYW